MKTSKSRALISIATAATLFSGCVAPVPVPLGTAERHSSMVATDASCPGSADLGAKFDQPMDPARPNQPLIAEALQQLVNAERCRQGAAPLALSAAGIEAAAGHAHTMAERDFIGHHSPIPGRETLQQRLDAENISYGWAAENVARAAASSLSGRGDGCFLGGSTLSHGDVAKALFAMWMDSSGHRSNILGPNFRAVGAGVGINSDKYRCGEVTSTMVLVG